MMMKRRMMIVKVTIQVTGKSKFQHRKQKKDKKISLQMIKLIAMEVNQKNKGKILPLTALTMKYSNLIMPLIKHTKVIKISAV